MEKNKEVIPLTKLKIDDTASVVEIKTGDLPKLRKLAAFGLMPGSIVTVIQKYPAIIIQSGYTELALDEDIASEILVAQ